jgi:hypothetical protein
MFSYSIGVTTTCYWVLNNDEKLVLWEQPLLGDWCAKGRGVKTTTALWVWSTCLLFRILQWTHSRMKCVAGLPKCCKPSWAHELLIGRDTSCFYGLLLLHTILTQRRNPCYELGVLLLSKKKTLKGITTLFGHVYSILWEISVEFRRDMLPLSSRQAFITMKVEMAHYWETWVACRVVFWPLTKSCRSMQWLRHSSKRR